MCARIGANEIGDFRATSLATLAQMVANGIGVTLLPRLAADVEVTQRQKIALVPFGKSAPSRTIGLAWRRSSPRRSEFVELGTLLAADSSTRGKR